MNFLQFISDSLRSCLSCGLSIREINFAEHAVDELNDAIEGLINDLVEKLSSEAFLEEDIISIEENDGLYNLKVFLNDHMGDYEWDEFLEFYNSSDKSLSIEEIKDEFLEAKSTKSLDSEDDLNTSFIYISYCYFHNLDSNRFDDAFVYFVQMLILASKKSFDKNHILETTPYTLNNMMCIDDLKNLNFSFNVLRLFVKAVETFKIEKYNNNHSQVLKELKDIFFLIKYCLRLDSKYWQKLCGNDENLQLKIHQ